MRPPSWGFRHPEMDEPFLCTPPETADLSAAGLVLDTRQLEERLSQHYGRLLVPTPCTDSHVPGRVIDHVTRSCPVLAPGAASETRRSLLARCRHAAGAAENCPRSSDAHPSGLSKQIAPGMPPAHSRPRSPLSNPYDNLRPLKQSQQKVHQFWLKALLASAALVAAFLTAALVVTSVKHSQEFCFPDACAYDPEALPSLPAGSSVELDRLKRFLEGSIPVEGLVAGKIPMASSDMKPQSTSALETSRPALEASREAAFPQGTSTERLAPSTSDAETQAAPLLKNVDRRESPTLRSFGQVGPPGSKFADRKGIAPLESASSAGPSHGLGSLAPVKFLSPSPGQSGEVPGVAVLSGMDGLYEVLVRVAGPQRLVIWASASADYLDLVHNWYTSVEAQGYGGHVLLVAEDDAAFRHMSSRWPERTVSGTKLQEGQGELDARTGSKDRGFGAPYYNMVVDRRPEYFKALLNLDLNITFLYNDVDIVWLKDPLEHLKGDFDVLMPEDSSSFVGALERFPGHTPQPAVRGQDLCTCFMLLRPTVRSRTLVLLWTVNVRRASRRHGAVLNQPQFNQALMRLGPDHIRAGVLPPSLFPSGCLYFGNRSHSPCELHHQHFILASAKNLTNPVVVHNNWVVGHQAKVRSFQESGLWMIGAVGNGPLAGDRLQTEPISPNSNSSGWMSNRAKTRDQ